SLIFTNMADNSAVLDICHKPFLYSGMTKLQGYSLTLVLLFQNLIQNQMLSFSIDFLSGSDELP
ncbi:MAG: hypothetical protein J5934_07410, partial [Succinivibrio sp.]|nr:hypothetical protein [Succinivibrio sp.]